MRKSHHSIWDWFIGGFAGLVVAAIVAVNLVITAGIGYDVTLAEVFRQNTFIGIVTILILASGPIVGFLIVRRLRRPSTAIR